MFGKYCSTVVLLRVKLNCKINRTLSFIFITYYSSFSIVIYDTIRFTITFMYSAITSVLYPLRLPKCSLVFISADIISYTIVLYLHLFILFNSSWNTNLNNNIMSLAFSLLIRYIRNTLFQSLFIGLSGSDTILPSALIWNLLGSF